MVGAYLALSAVPRPSKSFWLAWLLAPLGVALIGGLLYLVLLRHMQRADPMKQVLVTFGLIFVGIETVDIIWGSLPHIIDVPELLSGRGSVLGQVYPTYRLFIIALGAAAFVLLYLGLERTRVGAIVRAGVDDRTMVAALGIDIGRVFFLVFCLGCLLAGVAGGRRPCSPLAPGMSMVTVRSGPHRWWCSAAPAALKGVALGSLDSSASPTPTARGASRAGAGHASTPDGSHSCLFKAGRARSGPPAGHRLSGDDRVRHPALPCPGRRYDDRADDDASPATPGGGMLAASPSPRGSGPTTSHGAAGRVAIPGHLAMSLDLLVAPPGWFPGTRWLFWPSGLRHRRPTVLWGWPRSRRSGCVAAAAAGAVGVGVFACPHGVFFIMITLAIGRWCMLLRQARAHSAETTACPARPASTSPPGRTRATRPVRRRSLVAGPGLLALLLGAAPFG